VADRHVQGAGGQLAGLAAVDRPAHATVGPGVLDDVAVELALAGGVLGDVGNP
jgi:hypothetical protein